MSLGKNGVGIQWQSIIQGAILFLAIGGAFWALAYNPIQNDIRDLKSQLNDLRNVVGSSDNKIRDEFTNHDNKIRDEFQRHTVGDDSRYLTQKEHNEFKNRTDSDIKKITDALEITRKETETRRSDLATKIEREFDDLKKLIETRRVEIATKADLQTIAQATRTEMLAEIKRLDQREDGDMKRLEFDAWKYERDKTIGSIQERQNRFAEALDAMYTRILAIVGKP